jgi:hypothetical protein
MKFFRILHKFLELKWKEIKDFCIEHGEIFVVAVIVIGLV